MVASLFDMAKRFVEAMVLAFGSLTVSLSIPADRHWRLVLWMIADGLVVTSQRWTNPTKAGTIVGSILLMESSQAHG